MDKFGLKYRLVMDLFRGENVVIIVDRESCIWEKCFYRRCYIWLEEMFLLCCLEGDGWGLGMW